MAAFDARRPPHSRLLCGQDDFLVGRAGKERFEALAKDVTDEFSRGSDPGLCRAMSSEVEAAVNAFRESVQTVPIYGGKRAVWLKDVNYLGDSVTGRAERTLAIVEDLQALLLQGINPERRWRSWSLAAPVDRRRSFAKWCEKNSNFVLADGGEGGDEALAGGGSWPRPRPAGPRLPRVRWSLLLAQVGANSRLLVEEVRKLSAHAGDAADHRGPRGRTYAQCGRRGLLRDR